jgi:ethanolamine ammonia-lyase small subunit
MDETEDSRTPAAADAATESAVLQRLLDLHPVQLTVAELVREVGGESPSFAERDAIERAIRDLTGAGLVHDRDGFAIPTRAALRFSELLDH